MRHKRDPHRQCIGCRKVRQKKELLRLVFHPAGKVSFDPRQTSLGRGFYLCPEKKCFSLAYKNSRWRKFFLGDDGPTDLFLTICATVRSSIEQNVALGKKMNCVKNTDDELDTLDAEDIVIMNSDISNEQKIGLYTAAQEKGTAVFSMPGDCMNGVAYVTVKHRFPLISHIKRALRVYERLSSKGLVL